MSKKFLACTAAAIFIGSPVFAATSQITAQHPATAKHASVATAKKAVASSHINHNQMAKKVSVRGKSEVRALNALESQGYRQLSDLHSKGSDFIGTARKNGKLYNVTVMPSGQIRAASA